MCTFNREALVAFAGPFSAAGNSDLKEALKAFLEGIAPPSLSALQARLVDRQVRGRLSHLREVWKERKCKRPPESGLEQFARTPVLPQKDMPEAARQYRKRLPGIWVDWVFWTLEVYHQLFARDCPELMELVEGLVRVEAQLQVLSDHVNRDHVVHQLGDALMGVKLFDRWYANVEPAWFDSCPENTAIMPCLARLGLAGTVENRAAVWKAGLCLAGLFHDVGYMRYPAELCAMLMAETLGHGAAVPRPQRDRVARLLADSHLVCLLDDITGSNDGLAWAVELYDAGWDSLWHGPLSAVALLGVARQLRLAGRQSAIAEASLQLAATAAFLHEVHLVKKAEEDDAPWDVVREIRAKLTKTRLPLLFRLVDELQCWFRPELKPREDERTSLADFGLEKVELTNSKVEFTKSDHDAAKKAGECVCRLLKQGGAFAKELLPGSNGGPYCNVNGCPA